MLKGKTAIITGGSRGIGKAIGIEMAKEGSNIVFCYRSNDEEAIKTKEEIETFNVQCLIFKGDVCDSQFAKLVVTETKKMFETIDILVNNAGITKDKLMIKMKDEDFLSVINSNLAGPFYFTREVSRIMAKNRWGRIINISSIAGLKGNPGQVNYSSSKAGIVGLTMSSAKELGKRGITVNAIAPGMIETDMTDALTEEQRDKILSSITVGRFGKAEEVAKLATFLASENCGYITGQVITIDGGTIM